jgi:hypothetical protein
LLTTRANEDGGFTGNRRYRDQAHEILGVSPAIIARLLHNSIFLNLKDLGVELPPYTEEVVELDMDGEHGRQNRGMESILRHMARRDQRYLSLWLQWALSRPQIPCTLTGLSPERLNQALGAAWVL